MTQDVKRSARPDAAAGEAARVGEELRDARIALGYSLEEAAARLRINRRYLAALEEGRVRDLPGPAYALGFVRSYATALGLDADEMVRRFRDSSGAAVRHRADLVFPEPVPERGVPAGAVVLVGVLVAIGGYVMWWQSNGLDQRSVDAVPPLPPAMERLAEQGAAALPGPAAVEPARAGAEPPRAAAEPRSGGGERPAGAGQTPPTQGAAPPPNGAMAANGAAPGPPPSIAGVEPGRLVVPRSEPPPLPELSASGIPYPAPPAPPPPAQPASPAPPPGTPRVVLRATEPAWVQVRDPRSGQVLQNRTLRAGERLEIPPDRQGLVLDTGRAEGLVIELDGRAVPALSGRTGVVRGILLDPARLAE